MTRHSRPGQPAAASDAASTPSAKNSLGGRVLVIDDSEIARAQMVRMLADAGMDVFGLPSPIGATRAILDNNVVVVVIDVLMPSMRGDRLAALFRGNARFRKLGVVLVTGEHKREIERLSEETDADAVISKAELHQLVPAVHKARAARARAPAGS